MKSIIEAVFTKNRGLTRQELLKKTGILNSGEFSNYLKALISGGFIIKYCSFGESKRDEFYKLIDPFCIFYLRFVKETLSGKKVSWTNICDSAMVRSWSGYAYENVCFNHVKQIKNALGISGVSTMESLWSKKGNEDTDGTQIDMIIERKDNIVNMCEIKFYSDLYVGSKNSHFDLVRKNKVLSEFIKKKEIIHNTLITTYGLKDNEYRFDYTNVITLDDLFE